MGVLSEEKKRGKERNGSDFCDRLHRIPGYRPDSSELTTQYSSVSLVGAGKTSLILKCLPQLPPDHKVVLLKNEFGDVQGDAHAGRRRLELKLTDHVVVASSG